jgi:hypothetical protein
LNPPKDSPSTQPQLQPQPHSMYYVILPLLFTNTLLSQSTCEFPYSSSHFNCISLYILPIPTLCCCLHPLLCCITSTLWVLFCGVSCANCYHYSLDPLLWHTIHHLTPIPNIIAYTVPFCCQFSGISSVVHHAPTALTLPLSILWILFCGTSCTNYLIISFCHFSSGVLCTNYQCAKCLTTPAITQLHT